MSFFIGLVVLLITVALIFINLYIVAYYCHPNDKGSSVGAILKLIVIVGLTLTWIQILLIPFDVSSHRTFGNNMDMKAMWYIIYILTIIYCIVVYPISKSYYETDENWTQKEKLMHSFCIVFIRIAIFLLFTLIYYFTSDVSKIDVTATKCFYEFSQNSTEIIPDNYDDFYCETYYKNFELDSDFYTTSIAYILSYSWLIFLFFGGIGLATVPIDFFYDFSTRPKHINNSPEINEKKIQLSRDVEEVRYLGEEVKRLELQGANKKFIFNPKRYVYDRKYNRFRTGCDLIDKSYEIVNAEKEVKEKDNFVYIKYYSKLPLGILSALATLLWIIQFVCSYFARENHRPKFSFLSSMFIFFQDHDMAFITFILYALMNLYLLYCTLKGSFKFCYRFFCCWYYYPIKKNGTYMDSFLFNIYIILMTSCAVTHFSSECFYDYVAFTDMDTIFNIMIKNLKYFDFFYTNHIFPILLFIMFVISLFYFLWKPHDTVNAVINRTGALDSSFDSSQNANTNAQIVTQNNLNIV